MISKSHSNTNSFVFEPIVSMFQSIRAIISIILNVFLYYELRYFFCEKKYYFHFLQKLEKKKSKCSFIGAKQYIEEYLGWLGVILLSCKCKPVCLVWNTVNLRSSVLKGRLMLKSSQWINCEFKTDSRECKSFCCYWSVYRKIYRTFKISTLEIIIILILTNFFTLIKIKNSDFI